MRHHLTVVQPAVFALALFAGLAATPSPARSQPFETARMPAALLPADRDRVFAFVTTYDTEGLLADPVVQAGLAGLRGLPLDHLKRNLDEHGPVGYSSGLVFVQGNAPHHGGQENAFLGVNLHNGQVCAAFLTQGRIVVYANQSDYNALPVALRDWILMTFAYERTGGGMPQNVDLR
ncbi:MAG TPA: hypothetical protein VFM17_00925 [Candidatus Eisenbacteria bacterium]|nr:hypothetical protein [Candidatus Eisenbacteria bacterium]